MPLCETCGDTLSTPFSLKRHEKTHHRDEKHRCHICNKFYARNDTLLKHIKDHHEASVELQTWQTLDNAQLKGASRDVREVWAGAIADRTQHLANNDTVEQGMMLTEGGKQHQALINDFTYATPLSSTPDLPGPCSLTLYDDLGRVASEHWLNGNETPPPSPKFLIDSVQAVQDAFPNARIDSAMHLCAVHARTRVPMLRPSESVDLALFQWQYVPVIRCLSCGTSNIFTVHPSACLSPVEDHLHSQSHARAMRLGYIAESATAKEAVYQLSDGKGVSKVLKDITNQAFSLQHLNDSFYNKARQGLLILAVKMGEKNVLQYLLEEGLSVRATDVHKRSALFWACYMQRDDMSGLLIHYGAPLNDEDGCCDTPLSVTIRGRGFGAAIQLIQIQAEVHKTKRTKAIESPLALACRYGIPHLVTEMIRLGADVDEHERGTLSPLVAALRWSSVSIVEVLLNAGAATHRISWEEALLLRNKRDGFARKEDSADLYGEAADKILLLKAYGCDIDSYAIPVHSESLRLTIPTTQPHMLRGT